MQFYNPKLMVLLWTLLPLLIFIFWAASYLKERRERGFGNFKTFARMSNLSARNLRWKSAAVWIACCFAIIALLRPQWGNEKKKIERKGVDVIFLLDTSLSMLAADTKPSRIEKAKLEVKTFVKNVKGDRIGLIPFAGSSFLQCPLTLDYAAFFLFLDAVEVGFIPDPGSSLRDAVENAVRSFPKGEKKYRVIIIFSDGEFHGEDLETSIRHASEEGVRIYTVGVGTREGEPIPLRAEKGKIVGYKKDSAGQVVLSKLNETVLTEIANRTGGLYLPATASEQEIDLIYESMQGLGKKGFGAQFISEREERYQLFLFLAFLFLLLDSFLVERHDKITVGG